MNDTLLQLRRSISSIYHQFPKRRHITKIELGMIKKNGREKKSVSHFNKTILPILQTNYKPVLSLISLISQSKLDLAITHSCSTSSQYSSISLNKSSVSTVHNLLKNSIPSRHFPPFWIKSAPLLCCPITSLDDPPKAPSKQASKTPSTPAHIFSYFSTWCQWRSILVQVGLYLLPARMKAAMRPRVSRR